MKKLLIFVAGAVVGSAATWYFAKNKYEKIAQEEIDSVKEKFLNKDKKEEFVTTVREKVNFDPVFTKEEVKTYSTHTKTYKPETKEQPYVITPDEYGNEYEYEAICLTYYSDGILTDDWDELVENPDETVGLDYVDHFGDYEEDIVFVRNDKLKCDFEISRDKRSYFDVVGKK